MTSITQLWKQATRRSVASIALLLAIALAATACGASPTIAAGEAASGGSGADGSSAGTLGSATFTRGEATLPADLCPGDGQLLANVLHLDDLAAAGLPLGDELSASRSTQGNFSIPNYPEKGQINCGASLGAGNNFYFELHRRGRGLANNYDVLEQHNIDGIDFVIYAEGGQTTLWAEALFPNEYSPVGATSLVFGYSQPREGALEEGETAAAFLDIAELVLPLVSYDPPVPVVPTVEAQVAPTPTWWFGCDADNFVLEGFDPNVVFTALGEPAAESVKLSDNPLGVGLITDCRTSNGDTRVSIIAVPPIGGLTESVDDALALEEGAEERTVAGNRSAVYADTTGFNPSGSVQITVDVYTIIVNVEDRDSRRFSAEQLKQMAVTAAEAFLSQV